MLSRVLTGPRNRRDAAHRPGKHNRRYTDHRRRAAGAPPGRDDDYGLLRTVALVDSLDTGMCVVGLLAGGSVRATVATGSDGLVRVLVFPDGYPRARRMVSWVL
jgi:hypothetical protein